jgi:hypothetical protein
MTDKSGWGGSTYTQMEIGNNRFPLTAQNGLDRNSPDAWGIVFNNQGGFN